MSGSEDFFNAVRKVVGDKPLYLLAGASDLVNEKLRELPDRLTSLQDDYKEFPMRAAGTLAGQFFRANLKIGELYDDLTRRGEEVVARMRGEAVYDEEDEPFVREPFMPEPVHPPAEHVQRVPVQPAAKTPAKRSPAEKTVKKAADTTTKSAAGRKTAAKKTAKKSATTNSTANTSTARKGTTGRRPASES